MVDKLITSLPEVVRALAARWKTSTRSRSFRRATAIRPGMSKITGDIAKMAAQVPALFETLSGMQMSELFGRIRSIGDKSPTPTIDGNGGGESKAKGAGA